MNDYKKCWEILPKISRSFALCIALLPKPINERMMLAYMIFRIIDTIEDSTINIKIKATLFNNFISILEQQRDNPTLSNEYKTNLFKNLIFSYEADLLINLDLVVRLYYLIPKSERMVLLKHAKEMAKGMYKFQGKGIKSFTDQDEYCHYVAGLIGHLTNDLFYHNGIITKYKMAHLMEPAKRYGLGLQKINIIRDVAYDIANQRYYWPENLLKKYKLDYKTICLENNRKEAIVTLNEMIRNAIDYLSDGLYYVTSLPKKALKVRIFCLIPLFMAIESSLKCTNNEDVFIKGRKVKIPRKMVNAIVKKSYLYGYSNTLLKSWFNKRINIVKEMTRPIHLN